MKLTALILLIGCATTASAFGTMEPPRTLQTRDTTPTAAEFARALAGATNQVGGGRSVANVHCAKGAPGLYMCSYTVVTRTGRECHLMQGMWTPDRDSTITVTLSGRVRRCQTLRAAVHSLG